MTGERYDVVVVGARCAGAATALLLARRGYRVLLLDRASLPSDTLSTHYIHPNGLALLARWGLLDALMATGCPRIERISHQVGDVWLEAKAPVVDGVDFTCAPRRQVLDAVLADAAVAAGAELRDACEVVDVTFDKGRPVGVTYRTRAGGRDTVAAELIVGADGMRSTVAERVGAPIEIEDQRLTCIYYTYWTGIGADFELYEQPGRLVGALPTHNDQTLVCAYFPSAEFAKVREHALDSYLDNIRATAPGLFDRVAAGTRTERLRGTNNQRNFFRQACGPGWVLVGDAGHHKDSITARGITDAFEQAAMLADCVGDGLHDEARLREGLRRFAEQRIARFNPLYRMALLAGTLDVSPYRLAVLRFLSTRPDLVERYFAVGAGIIESEQLFNRQLFAEMSAHRAGTPR
ncbi:NAD(P)/FAD-dependent oxidoreductase [Dactylosporangium fulvum]|uniref:FAD-dependent monooxygenase n=1 Tax=Dactylosporangium fulvum TaxID=53359 RepID=A0ABY5VVS2_9ACTN|nr:FAD-dependent monooxygenase [Dactylosporangium fulvum]UWP80578.1 FAD-dependent monooxygenase [Dactylosporangium fulvum]